MESGKQSASSSVSSTCTGKLSASSSTTEYVNALFTESVVAESPVVSINVTGGDVLPPEDEGESMKVIGIDDDREECVNFEEIPKTKFRNMYLAALAALVNAVCIGMSTAYSATATDNMKGPGNLNPSDDEITWIGSVLAIGALTGSLPAGTLASMFGRKKALLFNTIPFFMGWVLIAYAPSVLCVLLGRLLTGFACGLACVTAPTYLVEISTPEVRGLLGSSFQLFITIGVLLVSILGYYISWSWLAISGASITTLSIIVLSPMPETPRWLMSKGRPLDATMALKYLQGKDFNVSATCSSLEDSIKVHSAAKLAMKEFNKPKRMVMKMRSVAQSPAGYKSAALSFALMLFQQFSGINAIMFYTVAIFKAAGSQDPKMHTIILNVVQVMATFLGSVLMDKAGRKILLLVSGGVMALSLILLGSYGLGSAYYKSLQQDYAWIPLVCLGLYVISFSVGFGPIPWLMVAEMTPSRFRSLISGVATALNWTFVFVVTKSYSFLNVNIKNYGTFWLYALFCGASCFVTYFFIPETKGKTLDEIQQYFMSKSRKEVKLSLAVHGNSMSM